MSTSKADDDNEDKGEEGDGDHEGIPENLPAAVAHDDWPWEIIAALYEETSVDTMIAAGHHIMSLPQPSLTSKVPPSGNISKGVLLALKWITRYK